MAFEKLERTQAKTLTMGKEDFNEITGLILAVRTNIGRNNSSLYRIRTQDGVVQVWGNPSIDESLLNDTGRGLKPEATGKLVRITVLEMVPVGDNGALRAECEVQVDKTVRSLPPKSERKAVKK